MPTEQPAQKRKAPRNESRLEQAANAYELADASALKAVFAGTADPEQQKRAINWILKVPCSLGDWPYVVGDADQTHVHLGRQFVGHQIMKLIQAPLGEMRRREPNADAHEQG